MLRITMPTSFEPRLLDELAELNLRHRDREVQVAELFGSLPRSRAGCGRPARSLAPVGREDFEAHVRAASARGFAFSYLFNGSCSGNREHDPRERALLLDEMEWVASLPVRSVVVASPFLIDLVRRHFPRLRVHVSCVTSVRSLSEVAHHVRDGAARLILDPDTIRDLAFVRRVREAFPGLELEALANHPCLMNCPYEAYCYNTVSHASSAEGAPYEAYALLRCNLDKLRDPAGFVRGSWFRPQDAHHFEAAGVDVLKLAGRGRSTDWLLRTAGAYLSRRYDGNMMDLVWEAQWTAVGRSLLPEEAAGLPPLGVEVPAGAFDGFIDLFAARQLPCRSGCGSCRICPGFARRAVRIDETARQRWAGAIEQALARLTADPRQVCG